MIWLSRSQAVGHFTNARGNLVAVREFSGSASPYSTYSTTIYGYDVPGNLMDVQDQANNHIYLTYDAFGRKIEMSDPDMGDWSYVYDAAGNLTEQLDANGSRFCFIYDGLDRLLYKRHDHDGNGCASTYTQLAQYIYYASGSGLGQLSEIRWSSSSTQNRETFSYDSLARLTSHTRTIDSRVYTMSYSGFDSFHRPTSRTITYPNGNTENVSLTFDHEGENTQVVAGATVVEAVGYNEMGQLKRLALGNNLTTWLGYHGYEGSGNNDAYDAKEVTWGWGANSDFGRLWRLCTAPDSNTRCQAANKDLAASGQVVDLRHAYDNGGNLTSHRDYLNSNQLQSFGYDHRDRLTTASTNAVGAGQYSHTYGYTTLGNMTSYAGGSSYNYTTWSGSCPTPLPTQAMPHAVKKIGSQYFCYDNNGNMTKRYDGSSTYTQSFNNENELTSVVVNGQTTTFTYDAAGIRVKTIEPGGSITHYYPFPGYEEEVNGATITRHTSYASAGQTVALRVRVVGGSNTLYYQHSDHLGSTVLLTNISGGAVANTTARYYPFGDWRTEPTAALTDTGYTGHRHNNQGSAPDDIGLIYMNARWYLPGLGCFISADTIVPNPTNPQSYNRYSYVRNNTLNFTDPTGHRECGASDDCSDPLPPTSTFQEALLQAWIYYEDNFDFPFEGTQNITQGFGRDHDGVDYGGEFTVRAPASGVVEQDTFRDPPAGMWMIQNSTTGEILTWSRWRTDPGWQGELYESNRGSDGLLEPERLLRTGEWDDIRNANPNTEPNWSHTTGTMIKLNHSHGLATTYIHTVPTLTVGQQVEQGDTLGVTANNGWSSGTHLHYRLEFTYGGRTIYLNPLAPPRQIAHLLP